MDLFNGSIGEMMNNIEGISPLIIYVTFVSICAGFGYKSNERLNCQARRDLSNRLHSVFRHRGHEKNYAALLVIFLIA